MKTLLTPNPVARDPFLSTAQAAALLGMHPGSLVAWRYLARVGKSAPPLPYVKVGGRAIRYRLSDVEAFIAARRTHAKVAGGGE